MGSPHEDQMPIRMLLGHVQKWLANKSEGYSAILRHLGVYTMVDACLCSVKTYPETLS